MLYIPAQRDTVGDWLFTWQACVCTVRALPCVCVELGGRTRVRMLCTYCCLITQTSLPGENQCPCRMALKWPPSKLHLRCGFVMAGYHAACVTRQWRNTSIAKISRLSKAQSQWATELFQVLQQGLSLQVKDWMCARIVFLNQTLWIELIATITNWATGKSPVSISAAWSHAGSFLWHILPFYFQPMPMD